MNDNKSIVKMHAARQLPENWTQQSTGSIPSDTDDEKLDSHLKGDSEGIDTAEKVSIASLKSGQFQLTLFNKEVYNKRKSIDNVIIDIFLV